VTGTLLMKWSLTADNSDATSTICQVQRQNSDQYTITVVLHIKYSCPTTRYAGTKGVQPLLILDFSTRWDAWSVSCPGHALPPGKDPQYPWYRRLGGPQSWSRLRGYRKNPLPLPGIEPWSFQAHIPTC
jgi:hypothetical protein